MTRKSGDLKIQKQTQALLGPSCQKGLIPMLKKELVNEKLLHQAIFYRVLIAWKGLTRQESDFFYTIYLLRGPVVGDIFNRAWNALSSLGQNFERRKELLGRLQKQDPLEGKVFASKDQKLQRVIRRHFSQNFPEYIEYYGKTCLAYLEGKKVFPRGNPTLECDDFFEEGKDLALMHSRYLKIKKRATAL